jgi:hypothetical protein
MFLALYVLWDHVHLLLDFKDLDIVMRAVFGGKPKGGIA